MLKPRLFDTHTHLQFKAFDKDREKVIKRALESGVFCVNVGTQKDTSKAAVELAEKYNGFWAAVGLHPIHTEESYHDEQETSGVGFKSREEVFDFDFYEKLASHPKVAAIGECGFDYYRTTPESRVKQEGAFRAQVRLAKKIGKPLMLHCRPSQNPDKSFSNDAYLDVFRVLKEEGGDKAGGNAHFFAGDWQIAEKFLDLGFYLSFTGVITFARQYDEVLKKMPLDRLMIETDAPYVAPAPYRGQRNEPLYVEEIAKKIAVLRGVSFEKIAEAIVQNAIKFFGIS